MNQCDATTAVILFFRERPEGEAALANDKQLARAVKVLEKRAEVLRVRLQRRRTACLCACGQGKATNVVCWHCWQRVPENVVANFREGTTENKRCALRIILDIAKNRLAEEAWEDRQTEALGR